MLSSVSSSISENESKGKGGGRGEDRFWVLVLFHNKPFIKGKKDQPNLSDEVTRNNETF